MNSTRCAAPDSLGGPPLAEPDAAHAPDHSLSSKLRRAAACRFGRRPAPRNPDRPLFSVSFDDPPASSVVVGAPVLESRGVRGTWFVASGLFGTDSPMGPMMRASDLDRLAGAGHEIACHTASHLNCSRNSASQIAADLEANRLALGGLGFTAETFAYPFGQAGFSGRRVAGGRFAFVRGVRDGLVGAGTDLIETPAVALDGPMAAARGAEWIARAAAERLWLIFFTHDVRDAPSAFGTTSRVLAETVDLALAAGLEPVTVAEGARRVGAILAPKLIYNSGG